MASDLVVEDHADHVRVTFNAQEEAIQWARTHNYSPTSPSRCLTSPVARSFRAVGNIVHHFESGPAMLSRDLPSASIPYLSSVPAAVIRSSAAKR
jgi:hypothetical protein